MTAFCRPSATVVCILITLLAAQARAIAQLVDRSASPSFKVVTVTGPTFGDLFPESVCLGASAKSVPYELEIRNLSHNDLNLTIRGILRAENGAPTELSARPFTITRDTVQKITYDFSLPARGRYELSLVATGDGGSIELKRWLTTTPVSPTWVTPKNPRGDGLSVSGPGATGSIDIDVPADMSGALVYISYQRRVREPSQGSEAMDVLIAPRSDRHADGKDTRALGAILLSPLTRFGTQERWAVLNAGRLTAGQYRLTFKLPQAAAASTTVPLRPAMNIIRKVGIVSDIDQGRWLPPVGSLDPKNVATTQEARLLSDAVYVESVSCDETGHLFLGSKVLGESAPPLPFRVTIGSRIVTAPVDAVFRARLVDASGNAIELPPVPIHLGPGERRETALPIRAPGYGWFSVDVTADAMNLTSTGHSAFGVLRDPHEGVRENSPFGLSIGETPQNIKVAELIGVKWRRGIPFTNPADVMRKTGDPLVLKPDDKITLWGEPEIAKARNVIAQWKQAGVMCLGYVNYNLPWNCLGGAAQGWHKNRPADMKQHVEMVYNLIKPLHDEVKYWEIWNEPWVGGWTWRTGTAQDYRDMSRMIWDRVKPEMPDVMLVGGGSTSYNRDVVFAAGSENAGYVDGVSTHPYGKPDTNHPSFAAIEAALLKKFAMGGGQGGIWATELGTAAYMFEPLPRAEADLMVARTVAPLYLLAKLGAGETPIHLFFFASQYGDGSFSGGEHNLWDATGGSPAPRPALVAFSAMTHFIEDTRLLGDIYASSKAAWALHFVKRDGTSVVAFMQEQSSDGDIDPVHASESERVTGEMTLPADDFEVYDYLGRPVGTRDGDRLRVPTRVWETRYFVSKQPVEQVQAALRAAEFKGLPTLAINPRSFDAPLASKPKLRLKIENLRPRPVDAAIDITTGQEIQLAQTRVDLTGLQPGETRWVSLPLASATPNEVNRYLVKYRVTVGTDVWEQQQTIQVACATFGTPHIDGDLADWSNATPVTMISRGGKDWRQITMDPSQAAALLAKKEPSDTTIYTFWTQWDEQNFYVAATMPSAKQDLAVPYNGPISTTKNMPFMHDCLQMAFASQASNPSDLLAGHSLYEKSMGADVDYEFSAALLSDGRAQIDRLKAPGTNFQTYYPTNADTIPPFGPVKQAQVIVRYDASKKTYVYELAIPWSELGPLGQRARALRSGESFITHLAFAVNDVAGPGRTYWTQEAGDLQAGSYGFSPTWGGGSRKMGGRILTDWSFMR